MNVTPVVTSGAFSQIASLGLSRVSSGLTTLAGSEANMKAMSAPHMASSPDVKMELMESESSSLKALDGHPDVVSGVPDSPCWPSANDNIDALSPSGGVHSTGMVIAHEETKLRQRKLLVIGQSFPGAPNSSLP